VFDFQPKINKNTEKLVKNREKKLAENKVIKPKTLKSPEPSKFRASEKILIIKFNKEFDLIRDEIMKLHKEFIFADGPKSARIQNNRNNTEYLVPNG
jgi:hypothetical protein